MQGSDAIQLTPVEPRPIIPPILLQTIGCPDNLI
jgi:hypothetical protein